MNIPYDAYETGKLTVLEKDEFAAKEAVRSYHADRKICLVRQKKQLVRRFCFLTAMLPLIAEPCYTYYLLHEDKEMCFFSVVFAAVAFVCVVFLRRLHIPAICSLAFLGRIYRDDLNGLIFCVLLPIIICCTLAFFYECDRRRLRNSPGYPDFRTITVRVLHEEPCPEAEYPAPPPEKQPAEDPYADILSPLQ